jgi:hypothetical protein
VIMSLSGSDGRLNQGLLCTPARSRAVIPLTINPVYILLRVRSGG